MKATQAETIAFVVFWVVAGGWRAWETFRKQGSVRGATSMSWSFYLLFAFSSVVFLGTLAEFFWVDRSYRLGWGAVGLMLFVVANLLRVAAIRALGQFWSLHIEIREQHQFVRTGPYRWVRHPAYLSFVLEHIAVPLVGNAWWSLAVALLGYLPVLLWRIAREDKALVAKFGAAYETYRREVGALLPRWPGRGA